MGASSSPGPVPPNRTSSSAARNHTQVLRIRRRPSGAILGRYPSLKYYSTAAVSNYNFLFFHLFQLLSLSVRPGRGVSRGGPLPCGQEEGVVHGCAADSHGAHDDPPLQVGQRPGRPMTSRAGSRGRVLRPGQPLRGSHADAQPGEQRLAATVITSTSFRDGAELLQHAAPPRGSRVRLRSAPRPASSGPAASVPAQGPEQAAAEVSRGASNSFATSLLRSKSGRGQAPPRSPACSPPRPGGLAMEHPSSAPLCHILAPLHGAHAAPGQVVLPADVKVVGGGCRRYMSK